ncbi:MAG: right-handed parallel beta-helix repeat-containing protein [Planctomycetes bacterium]|nr:right-handed parallel beta-helix repeat-containing protein [Planctomycetota bacterium]
MNMKKYCAGIFLLCLCLFTVSKTAFSAGPTYHSGYISSDETWYASGNPHIINGDVIARSSSSSYGATATLTIEAGCEVKFNPGTGLFIGTGSYVDYYRGALNAQGTSGSPITFTSNATTPSAGDWKGIYFYNGTYDGGTILSYCTVEYGGNTYSSNMYFSNASPTIQNCTIQNSSGYGIYCNDYSAPTITNNIFNNNATYPISMNPDYVDTTSGNTGSGNGTDAILVRSGYVDSNATWVDQGLFYFIHGNVTVRSSSGNYLATATLTINPGCEIKFNTGTGLFIGNNSYTDYYRGALNAQGTSGSPIIFTSNAATPSAGDWQGIYFYNGTYDGGTILDYCTVEYGGHTYNSNIYCNNSSPMIKNSTIQNSSANGIFLTSSSNPPIGGTGNGNTITNNSTYGIYCNSTTPVPNVTDNTITTNGTAMRVGPYMNLTNNICTGNTNNVIEVIGGYVDGDNIWRVQNGIPYNVLGDVTVRSSSGSYLATATLTIDAGCEVKFNPGTGLFIGNNSYADYYRGALNAQGTSGSPIIFTSNATTPSAGDWKGIYFYNGTYDGGTTLSYCTVSYGGYAYNANLYFNNASPTIQNCTIQNSSGYGIYCNDYSAPTIANNIFNNNATYPISMNPDYIDTTSGNTGSGNGTDAILVRGGYVYSNATWVDQGLFYFIYGDVTVRSSSGSYLATATLTINPGCEIKFNTGAGLFIGTSNADYYRGALYAQGTSGSPIAFTSGAATPSAGDWKGIYFYNGTYDGGAILSYCTIEYGGYSFPSSNIYCNNASPAIQNCIISKSSNYGVYSTGSSSTPSITCSALKENSYGVYATSGSKPSISNCNITNNSTYGVYNTGAPTLTAENNWWGDASGPSGVGAGTGDAVSNYVDYDPWLASSQSCVPTIIELVSFTAKADDDGNVIIRWETASEIDTVGFNLYRARQKNGTYEKINNNTIASEGSDVEGANYRFEDNKPGWGSFYYKIEDVDSYGVKTMHGTVKVRVKFGDNAERRR